MARKRFALTIDEEVFSKFQDAVVDYGYPKSSVSILVQKFMSDTLNEIDKHGVSSQLELFGMKELD